MSVRVMTLVWALELPDSEKIVLLALADCANDEGHCWPGMTSLSLKCSKSERTIQGAIKGLCDKGHLTRSEVIGKGCNYTVHPRSRCAPAEISPPQPLPKPPQPLRPTPAAAAPKPSENHKQPSLTKTAHELPIDWEPLQFSEGSESRKVVDGWPPGEFPVQVEMFKAQHGKKGDRFIDWQKAWSTWVLNTRRFGIGNEQRTNGLGRHQPSDGLSATTRAARKVFGQLGAGHQ
jgi:hypothetical protein